MQPGRELVFSSFFFVNKRISVGRDVLITHTSKRISRHWIRAKSWLFNIVFRRNNLLHPIHLTTTTTNTTTFIRRYQQPQRTAKRRIGFGHFPILTTRTGLVSGKKISLHQICFWYEYKFLKKKTNFDKLTHIGSIESRNAANTCSGTTYNGAASP